MPSLYKRILLIFMLIFDLLLISADILLYHSLSISKIWIILIIAIVVFMIIFEEKRERLLTASIIGILFATTIFSGMYTYKTFGSEQSIAAIQGYIAIVYQKKPYYMIPVEQLGFRTMNIGNSFICQKDQDCNSLSNILNDCYPRKKVKQIEKLSDKKDIKLFLVRLSDIYNSEDIETHYIYVHEKANYAWFDTKY